MKLKQSIPSTSVKIIELYNKIDSEVLDTSPDFQRKLVWKKQHKFHFIETILMNFPFPEVYIASSEMDIEALTTKEVVVDGKQRLTTIVEYIKGINDFDGQTRLTSFDDLDTDEKKEFLNYLVTVRDLKDLNSDLIKEIFQRINNTEYSLNTVEKTNAQYGDGEFVVFCKQLVDETYTALIDNTDIVFDEELKQVVNTFFSSKNIFTENDKTRMYDIQYAMLIVSTLIEAEYFGRNTKVNSHLKEYNSSFTISDDILTRLIEIFNKIDELDLNANSYWFYKPNLFSLINELSKVDLNSINIMGLKQTLETVETKSKNYFAGVELEVITDPEKKYFEWAREGINEKAARLHRAQVLSNLIGENI
ncbi:MAG: hypothetical protein COB12_09480 [Flavobacterium sp.]|nr:MAG: hypothetical protein COB12_09480 [Flavobacterium sp.]